MNLNTFEQLLLRAPNAEQMQKILTAFLADFGITTFSFTYYSYSANSRSKVKYDFSSANLKWWHEHYLEEKYDEIDTTMDSEYRVTWPIHWTIEQQIKEAKGPREKQMRKDSLKFGSVQGLCFPVHGPNDEFANLMVEEIKGQRCLEKWGEIKYDIFCAAHCFYHYLQKCLFKLELAEKKHCLSKREMQVISLVAKEHPPKEIARLLAISERTVNFHIQNVNKMLGTKSKYQSVAKLVSEKILNI